MVTFDFQCTKGETETETHWGQVPHPRSHPRLHSHLEVEHWFQNSCPYPRVFLDYNLAYHLPPPSFFFFFFAISLYYPWFHVMNLLFKGNYFSLKKVNFKSDSFRCRKLERASLPSLLVQQKKKPDNLKFCNFSLIQQRSEGARESTHLKSKERQMPPGTDRTGALAYLGHMPLDKQLKYLTNC